VTQDTAGGASRVVDTPGRRIDDLAGVAVRDEVLHAAPLARHRPSAAHALDELLVNLTNEPFADCRSAREIFSDELERAAVVQQLAHVVGVRAADVPSGPELLCLLDAELLMVKRGASELMPPPPAPRSRGLFRWRRCESRALE